MHTGARLFQLKHNIQRGTLKWAEIMSQKKKKSIFKILVYGLNQPPKTTSRRLKADFSAVETEKLEHRGVKSFLRKHWQKSESLAELFVLSTAPISSSFSRMN